MHCVFVMFRRLCSSYSIMQACCDVAFEYAHQRETFGQKIGTYQVCGLWDSLPVALVSATEANGSLPPFRPLLGTAN